MKKLLALLLLASLQAGAQTDTSRKETLSPDRHEVLPRKWYENISLRGYVQVRYNRLLETNPQLKCEQCDRSWGDKGGFFLRRVRLVFSGEIYKRIFFYIQPDFSSAPSSGGSQNFLQLRDAYVDIAVDKKNEFRFRLGQSKIPFGFENMQSSQNRLTLDRADALNSAFSNERDMGGFFYWAPAATRRLFATLVSEGLKGSGDYGVFGFGVFNGQTANRTEQNNALHMVARLSYPFQVGSQVIEPGIQAYKGKYVVTPDQLSAGTKTIPGNSYTDERVAASLTVYPKPLGLMAEYNLGRGPEFNPATDSVEARSLQGGYAMLNYMFRLKKHLLYPFFRAQFYSGGKKHELDARSYDVEEYEIGLEWQPLQNLEIVAQYTISSRRFEDMRNQDNLQKGNLLRLQAQVNF